MALTIEPCDYYWFLRDKTPYPPLILLLSQIDSPHRFILFYGKAGLCPVFFLAIRQSNKKVKEKPQLDLTVYNFLVPNNNMII